jgi:uncharacterized protein (TIGR03435 family)
VRLRLFLAIVPVAAILAQPSSQPGQYKLVNLKPNIDNAPFAVLNIPPGPVKFRAMTLKKLIMDAYGVPGFQIAGGPAWVSTDRWDFEAQMDGAAPLTTELHRQMLLRLLEDCFHIRAHRETRVMPIYELTMGSRGPNLRDDPWLDARGPLIKNGPGTIYLRNSSLKDFANRLALHLGRPVVDATGTTELFRISLDWTPDPGEDGGPEGAGFPPGTPMPKGSTSEPSIVQAIQEQLGLRLFEKESAVEVIVIDKAERPTAH